MRVSLRHLRLVAAVNDTGTLTGAAEQLFVTPSAISHQLADLERKLGSLVFYRMGRRMVATPVGERILETAVPTLQSVGALESELELRSRGNTGLIRITTQCYTSYHWLSEVLPVFRERFPGVDIQLRPEEAATAAQGVLQGRVDIAVMHRPPDDPRLRATVLFEDELVAVVHPRHRFSRKEFLDAGDFMDEELLVHSHNVSESHLFRHLLIPAGVTPRRITEIRLTEVLISLIRANEGIAVLSRWSILPDLKLGTVRAIPLTESGVRRNWSALTLSASPVTSHMAEIIRLLQRGRLRLESSVEPSTPRPTSAQG